MTKFCFKCVHHTIMGLTHFCTRRIEIDENPNPVTGLNDTTLKSGKYSICEYERRKTSTIFTKRCGPSGQFYEYGHSRITGITLANSNIGGVYD